MARNQEKAQAMLNRMITARKEAVLGPVAKRPHLASECTDSQECEKWRRQLIREISKAVGAIQNGSLGEHKIRDMNDHINKLLREKKHWERQIKYLGGADYMKSEFGITDADGHKAMGANGYYYFGAARDLPGVRELFEKVDPELKKRKRGELSKMVNADYYGYKDDDDGLLQRHEKKQELKAVAEAVADWRESVRARNKARREALGLEGSGDEEDEDAIRTGSTNLLKAHVVLPSKEEIEARILESRKAALMERLKLRRVA